MELNFTTEARFVKKGNLIYSIDGSFTNIIFDRYLRVFSSIRVFARVVEDSSYEVNEKYLINNNCVSFIELPYYIGPLQYLRQKNKIKSIIKENIRNNSVYICRVPGQIGKLMVSFLHRKNIKYGVEVVGDPWDVFSSGGVKHLLRVFFKYNEYFVLKKIVKQASAVLYVTKNALQNRYPAAEKVFTTNASNIQIKLETGVRPKRLEKTDGFSIISIGSLCQMYKAPDIVIKALRILKDRNFDVDFTWVGDGCYKDEMVKMAQEYNVDNIIHFVGSISRDQILSYLKKFDLFVLVSRTEGLPRVVIEAMSQGLPCIGTRVGGIPELLDDIALIQPNDEIALADKIEEILKNKDLAFTLASENIEHSKEYDDDILQVRRENFYKELIIRSTK